VLINTIEPGSPAEKAGLEKGDRITAINGTEIKSAGQLRIGLMPVGSHIEISFERKATRSSARLDVEAVSAL
jgi:serine protease DegQ